MKCTICGLPVVLVPYAEERAAKYGGEPNDYTRLFPRHSACELAKTGQRCAIELTGALRGLEGQRVEVTYPDGEKRRFWVGKSTGWMPCHLEITNRRSHGGGPVYFPEGSTVRVVDTGPR